MSIIQNYTYFRLTHLKIKYLLLLDTNLNVRDNVPI